MPLFYAGKAREDRWSATFNLTMRDKPAKLLVATNLNWCGGPVRRIGERRGMPAASRKAPLGFKDYSAYSQYGDRRLVFRWGNSRERRIICHGGTRGNFRVAPRRTDTGNGWQRRILRTPQRTLIRWGRCKRTPSQSFASRMTALPEGEPRVSCSFADKA